MVECPNVAAAKPPPHAPLPPTEAFRLDDYLFELKHDGFRGLAFVENGHCQLVSRRGHTCKKFAELCVAIADSLRAKTAVIDGEIVSLDGTGRSVFHNLDVWPRNE